MDQGSNFTSKAISKCFKAEGIETVYSPLNNHRAFGCVERTLKNIKNFILTYLKQKDHGKLEAMVKMVLDALRFSPNASIKMSRFEAHHGREANTQPNQKPSLQIFKRKNVLGQKSACLDTEAPKAQTHPARTNWIMRSDVEYDQQNMYHPLKVMKKLATRDWVPCAATNEGTNYTTNWPSRRS